MPVYEIEDVGVRLTKLLYQIRNGTTTTETERLQQVEDCKKLEDRITNWRTVLDNYRKHNNDVVTMFNAEDVQFGGIVSMYNSFLDGGISAADVKSAVDDPTRGAYLSSEVGKAFDDHYKKAFQKRSNACSNVIPSNDNAYLRGICKV